MTEEPRSYRTDIEALVAIQAYQAEEGVLGGNPVSLAAMSEEDSLTFVTEFDNFVQNMHPEVRHAFLINADVIWDTIRAVNKETRQGFGGMFARNKALAMEMVISEHIASATHSWSVTISSVAAADWLASATTPVSVGEEEAFVFVAVADPVAEPLVTRIVFAKNKDVLPQIHINWDNFENHVFILPEPIIVLSEETFYGRKYDAVVGVDKIQPIGIKILRGNQILTNDFS